MRVLFFFFIFLPAVAFSQQNQLDSLTTALAKAKNDSMRVTLHNALTKQYALSDIAKATDHAKAAERLASSIGFMPGLALAQNQRGRLLIVLGEYDKSLAIFYKALKAGQAAKDTALLVTTYTNLGILSNKTKDTKKALKFYATAMRLSKQSGNNLGLSKVYNSIGHVYAEQKKYEESLKFFKRAAQLPEIKAEKNSYSVILMNIGEVYTKLNQHQIGREYLFKALAIDKEIQNKMNLPVSLGYLAQSYLAEKKYPKALDYAQQSFKAASETGSSKKIAAASQLLNKIYATQKNYERAYHYQSIYNEHQAKLGLESQNRTAAEITARFENEKLDLETQKLKAEKEKQAIEIKHQKLILVLALAVLLLLLALVAELNLRRKHLKNTSLQMQKVNEQMQAQNLEIKQQKEEILQQANVLKKQNQELEKHNHFKSKIFSIVSHDLRSPFTTIQGILDLAKDDRLSEQDMKRIFGLLDKDVEVVMEMLNNLLVWSKNQMNGSGLHAQPVNLKQLAHECVQVVLPRANQKDITVENSIDLDFGVLADKESIAFVFRNLLVNAIKFSYPGEKVVLRAFEEEGLVKFAVVDFGKGISAKNLDKIFSDKRFTTLGTSQEVGTGLGLMLCKELLENQRGTIDVESEEGKGTTFTVSLPPAESKMVSAKEQEADLVLV